MFKYKALMFALMSGCMMHAMAAEPGDSNPAPVPYTYGSHPDIAKVISMTPIPNTCQVEKATMVYEDSQGQRHAMSYQVMGSGCENG